MGDRVAVIKKGELQQVDAPQTLYDHPSEPVRGGLHRLAGDEHGRGRSGARGRGLVRVVRQRRRLRVDDEVVADRPGIRAYEGKRVIVGIRPENMEDASIMPVIPEDRRMTGRHRPARGARVRGARALLDRRAPGADRGHAGARGRHGHVGRAARHHLGPRLRPWSWRSRAEIGSSTFVARLDPRTRAAERQPLELAVDTAGCTSSIRRPGSASTRTNAEPPASEVPRGVPVGRRDLRVPGGGRGRRGRPRPFDLGHVLPDARQGPRRGHGRRRVRPVPPVPGGRRAHGRARDRCVPVLGRLAADPARRTRSRPNPAGLDHYRRLVEALNRHGIAPVAHPVPLGPPPGARGRGRVAEPRHGRTVRRVRRDRPPSARRGGARTGSR